MNRTNFDEPQQTTRQPEYATAGRAGKSRPESDAQQRRIEMARLREVGRNLGAQVDEQVHKRPYVVLGAAAGIGFVAGSLLGSRLGQVLLAAGLGYAAKQFAGGDLGLERIQAGLERLTGEAGPKVRS